MQWRRRGEADYTNIVLVRYAPTTANGLQLESALEANENVEWAAPNRAYDGDPRELEPNDPQYGSQYHHALMQNNAAWDITLGDASIVIGITDDGLSTTHSDLAPNVWTNTDEIPGNGVDRRRQRLRR